MLRIDLPSGPAWVDPSYRLAPFNQLPAFLRGQDAYSMRKLGVRVYPMPYNERHVKIMKDGKPMRLKAFQRWVCSGAHVNFSWSDYRVIS